MRIGMDLDGVVYRWSDTARFLLVEEFGLDLQESDRWNYLQDNVTKEQWAWLWTEGVKKGLFRYGSLFKGSQSAMTKLASLGDIVVITSRPPSAHHDTLEWLAYQRFPTAEIHIVGTQPKSTVKCDLYVDDAPKNASDILENTNGIMLLWDRPWNQGYDSSDPRFSRVSSWQEVINHVRNSSTI